MIHHIYHVFAGDQETERRNNLAVKTWILNGIVGHPVFISDLKRTFQEGDQELTYVKDVIDFGCCYLSDDSLLLLTNLDTCASSDLVDVISKASEELDCGWARRRDFDLINKPIDKDEIKMGGLYPGTDLFFFRKWWWTQNRDYMPDLILGAEAWDFCLRVLMQRSSDRSGEIHDVIYHERHPAAWCQEENIRTWESQKYCIPLAKEFLKYPELIAQLSDTTRPAK